MLPKFAIRRAATASHSDAEGILECLRRAFAPYEQLYTPAGFRDTILTAETIQHRLRMMAVFVAVSDAGEICGTVGCAVLPVLSSSSQQLAASSQAASSKEPVASSEVQG